MNAFEINDLHHTYPDGTHALRGLSLAAPRGSRTALLGANGSGKSTLLLHFNGLLLPGEGTVHVLGRPVTRDNLAEIRRRVGLVFQNPDDQLFSTSVADDVAFGPRNLGLDAVEVQRRVVQALEMVGITDLAARPPHNLSLGQKKRAAVAGVLAMEPDLLVLDEPTAGLDAAGVRRLLDILARFHARGRTVVLATHNVDLAWAWAERVVVLSAGRLAAAGPVELLRDEELMAAASMEAPLLLRVFRETGFAPRDAAAARAWLRRRCGAAPE